MNRDNLLKLRAALEALPPEKFDYRAIDSEKCGCVLPVMERLFGPSSFVAALDAGQVVIDYLIGYESRLDPQAKDFTKMADAEATGAAGIAEAIRRIDVLLAREEKSHDA